MEDATKYGSSSVLLTSVIATKEKSNEIDGFPCVSPLDDGKNLVNSFCLLGSRMSMIGSSCCDLISVLFEGLICFLFIPFTQFLWP